MNNFTLEIKNLSVKADNKVILHNINLTIKSNEIHALLGPNGHGKSTLLHAIIGYPGYEIISGDILVNAASILDKSVDEKSKLGLFLAMQSPVEIPGIVTTDFMKAFLDLRAKSPLKLFDFYKTVTNRLHQLKMSDALVSRYLNVGFSGGEKKKNEILQMLLLLPKFAMLDETDSGLDVDALKVISQALFDLQKEQKTAFLIISHYDNLFSLIKPNYLHIMLSGHLVTCDDVDIIKEIQVKGFDFLYRKFNIKKPLTTSATLDKVTPF